MKPNLTTDTYKNPDREKKVPVHIRISIYLTSLTHIFGLNSIPTNSLVINLLPVNPNIIPVNHI